MLELYKNIKNRRKELGLSQEELAKMVGYTDRSSIAKIESGDVDLPQSKIVAFARALDISPGDLMGDPLYTPAHTLMELVKDPPMVEALQTYLTLPPYEKQHVIDTINLLGKSSDKGRK